jgi:hypothetical protein
MPLFPSNEKSLPGRRDSYYAASLHLFFSNEPSLIGVFPDRQSGTPRSPRIQHFFVAALAFLQPLEKIKNQVPGPNTVASTLLSKAI